MPILRRSLPVSIVLLLLAVVVAQAHDLFLRPPSFFVTPGETVRVRVLNGTFVKSESPVTFDRLRDLRVVGPAGTVRPDSAAWRVTRDSTVLTVSIGATGTYAIGTTLAPRELTLAGKDFNKYLEEDGIPDVLDARRRNGEMEKPARERYVKSVKALLQAGDARSGAYATVFGHPAELVPLENPYALRPGAALRVRALVEGAPVANQIVLSGGVSAAGDVIPEVSLRTDAAGLASIKLTKAGHWYVKFVNMVKATGEPAIDYQSKWATLTFGVR